MDALILTLFVSLVLVGGALVLLARSVQQGDLEHGDRLSLLPLDEDDPAGPGAAAPAAGREGKPA